MKRAGAFARELASLQLRCWPTAAARGLGMTAWLAVERAAIRYGYPNASAASHADATVMRDLFSEAIEDLESPD